jgi:hypothetical protein
MHLFENLPCDKVMVLSSLKFESIVLNVACSLLLVYLP